MAKKLTIGCGMARARRNRHRPRAVVQDAAKPLRLRRTEPAAVVKIVPDALRVRSYPYGGTNIARCLGELASATSDCETAACRAAAKAWSKELGRTVTEHQIELRRSILEDKDGVFLAVVKEGSK